MSKPQFQLGGQALIEGVMMRGPSHVGAAIRRADGTIETRVEEFSSILKKRRILNIFMVRGIFALVEMLLLGTQYLNWSASQAAKDIPGQKPVKLSLGVFLLTVLGALGIGAAIFVALPNFIAHHFFEPLIGNDSRPQIILLSWIEGFAKLGIFILYVYIIGLRKNIRRVFEYHGAEHKVVYAAENNLPLTPDSARPFDTPHPRCGTGFALLTIFVSMLIYGLLLPWQDNHFTRIGTRLLMLPVVAGVSYEILKATVNPRLGALAVLVMTPGMWLQRMTTAQPDDAQLEVACEAMRVVLEAEGRTKSQNPEPVV